MSPAVAYLRMSKESQDTSIPAQRTAIQQLAKSGGYKIIREYIDAGISGDATEKRVAFQQMLGDVSRGDFQAILCWDQDRFGRFDSLEAGFWILPLRNAGVKLVTVAQGVIDWQDFAGRILYTIQQEGKHQFLRDLSRNSNRGKLQAAQSGRWMGGAAPFGYALDADTRLIPHDDNAEIVRRIFKLRADGKSLRFIAMELDASGIASPKGRQWSANVLARIVANRVYLGHTRFNRKSAGKYTSIANGEIIPKSHGKTVLNDESLWLVIEDTHEPLIDVATFDKAQEARTANKRLSGPTSTLRGVFRSIIRCGWCGSRMHGFWIPTIQQFVYSCGRNTKAAGCVPNRTYQSELLAEVCRVISTEHLDPNAIAAVKRSLKARFTSDTPSESLSAIAKQVEAARKKLQAAEARLLKVPDDMISIVSGQIRDLRTSLASLEHRHHQAQQPRVDPGAAINALIDEAVASYRQIVNLSPAPSEALAAALRAAFESVTVWSIKDPAPAIGQTGRHQPNGRWHIDRIKLSGRLFPEK